MWSCKLNIIIYVHMNMVLKHIGDLNFRAFCHLSCFYALNVFLLVFCVQLSSEVQWRYIAHQESLHFSEEKIFVAYFLQQELWYCLGFSLCLYIFAAFFSGYRPKGKWWNPFYLAFSYTLKIKYSNCSG